MEHHHMEGHRGHQGHGGRYFGRGHIQYALLEILSEREMHGYQIMKELETRSAGMYIPSPGSIYPTLQMLEDQDFVQIVEVNGKKVYHITEAGRIYLRKKIDRQVAHHNSDKPYSFFQHDVPEDHLRISKSELLALIEQADAVAQNDPVKKIRMHKFYRHGVAKLRSIIDNSDGQGLSNIDGRSGGDASE